MQRVTISFPGGERRELCHDDTGGLFSGGFVCGLADDEADLASGGSGEVYSWGKFSVLLTVNCRGQCDDCPAA